MRQEIRGFRIIAEASCSLSMRRRTGPLGASGHADPRALALMCADPARCPFSAVRGRQPKWRQWRQWRPSVARRGDGGGPGGLAARGPRSEGAHDKSVPSNIHLFDGNRLARQRLARGLPAALAVAGQGLGEGRARGGPRAWRGRTFVGGGRPAVRAPFQLSPDGASAPAPPRPGQAAVTADESP